MNLVFQKQFHPCDGRVQQLAGPWKTKHWVQADATSAEKQKIKYK